MSKPPKIDRKELNRPDEFVQQGTHILELVVGHQKKIISVCAIGAIIALGFYFYNWRLDSQNEKGWKEYFTATHLPETERWESFKRLAKEYGSVASGQFMAVQLADHYFDEAKKNVDKDVKAVSSNVAAAVDWYSTALNYSKLAPSEKGLLLVNRASSYELDQKWDEAMNGFTDAVSLGYEAKPIALLGQGRIYEIKKDPAKAIQIYEKISADFLNTEYSKIAKGYLRRLKSPLFGESKS